MLSRIEIETEPGENLQNITERIRKVVQDSKIVDGLCVVYVPHTTAGITINSSMDIETLKDLVSEFRRIVPTRVDFNHIFDTPSDAAGHIKSVLVGQNTSIIIEKGDLLLGTSQSILFFEFDGPRSRQIYIKILSGSNN